MFAVGKKGVRIDLELCQIFSSVRVLPIPGGEDALIDLDAILVGIGSTCLHVPV